MLKVHPDRPALAEDMAPDALDRYYWYMAELVAYCREACAGWRASKPRPDREVA